jgi:predicted transcriptional regulator
VWTQEGALGDILQIGGVALIPQELERVRDALAKGQAVNPATVREFLSWFDVQRRGVANVERIRADLAVAQLYTIPDFDEPWLDAPISFARVQIAEATAHASGASKVEGISEQVQEEIIEASSGWEHREAGYRLSRLEAANKPVISIGLEDDISAAVTKMMLNDYSQLPVVNGRDVRGVVTWAAIGSRAILQGAEGKVAQFMQPAIILEDDRSIFEAITNIVQHDFVLVRARDKTITGIVTAADLSLQFRTLTEPFLLLSEIETHVRNIVGKKFTAKELSDIRDPNSPREINSVADLTFGEYVRLLQNPENWSRLDSRLDRAIFCGQLEKVSMIRNQVMHFDPDGLEEGHLDILRDFSLFLKRLEGLTVARPAPVKSAKSGPADAKPGERKR